MRIVLNNNTSASFNMAAEEYILKNFKEDVFMLWQADRTVLVGKNQNTRNEINHEYVEAHDIKVIRRLTGGGAIYCDLGNTNYAFISSFQGDVFANFKKFTAPILELLNELGVHAEFSGRNDLTIDGQKFSGNAQYKYKNRLLHHGSLLFSSNMEQLGQALSPPKIKFEGKAVHSVKSRVTNIKTHLPKPMDIEEFMNLTNVHIFNTFDNATYYEFTAKDLEAIHAIENARFANWEWNFGASPKYDFSNQLKFPAGLVEVNLKVKNGIIQKSYIYGDFFSEGNVSDICTALIGIRHHTDDIALVLKRFDIDHYFKNLKFDELIQLFE